LFSLPLVPFKTQEQIKEATIAARKRLASVSALKRIKEAQRNS
jgi:hypothetical protein